MLLVIVFYHPCPPIFLHSLDVTSEKVMWEIGTSHELHLLKKQMIIQMYQDDTGAAILPKITFFFFSGFFQRLKSSKIYAMGWVRPQLRRSWQVSL